MTDRIVIPLVGVGVLVLDGDTYRAALAEGAKLSATVPEISPSPPAPADAPVLVDADELGRLTSTPASWWLAAARESDCPSTWVGKLRRFNVPACLRWLEQAQERDGNGRARRCAVAPRAGA
jgi:hypothetical protein